MHGRRPLANIASRDLQQLFSSASFQEHYGKAVSFWPREALGPIVPTIPGISPSDDTHKQQGPNRTYNKTSPARIHLPRARRTEHPVERWLTMLAELAWLSLPPLFPRLRRTLCGTSLSGLWRGLALLWIFWGAAATAGLWIGTPAGAIDLLWYFVAIALLLPPVAVLGARRPIHRVWPWFVLLPLVLIFAWPALSTCATGKLPTIWNIEEPVLVGYCVVLVMGTGNYLGLRHTGSALLWMAGALLLAGPLCPATAGWFPAATSSRAWATLCLAGAAWLAARKVRTPRSAEPAHRLHALDAVWVDFQNIFGIVWARRLQDRFNEGMKHNRLPVRLGTHGLERHDEAGGLTRELSAAEVDSADTALRWLLQKFVDPGWIDARIGRSAPRP
jgi:hypothetical protein